MIRVGIAGLGVISHYYLAALTRSNSLRLTAVCDSSEAKLDGFGRRHEVEQFADYTALMRAECVDAVIVNLPNNLHFDACKLALAASKHVCCEKPLVMGELESRRLISLAVRHQRILFTAFHRRYNRHVKDVGSLRTTDNGGIAAVSIYYKEDIRQHAGNDSWYLDPAACGGGCIADNGPNAFDLAMHIVGDIDLFAASAEFDDCGIDIAATIELRSQTGLPVHIYLDWAYPNGEDKRIVLSNSDGTSREIDLLNGFPKFKSSLYHEYVGILEHFAHHVANRSTVNYSSAACVRLVSKTYQQLSASGIRN
ncbi:Gfo/Idh/MocA family protein [Rhizobium mongolense]